MINKRGGMTDIFIFMIVSFIIVLICGIFIYFGGITYSEIQSNLGGKMIGTANTTQVIDSTIGKVNTAYQSLYWISWFLIVGMVISIFIGSYLVTTKPVFFIPYIFVTIIAIVVGAAISNAYEQIIQTPELASIFFNMVGANFIMLKLPLWLAIIGIGGAIIMFSRMGSGDVQTYGGYQ